MPCRGFRKNVFIYLLAGWPGPIGGAGQGPYGVPCRRRAKVLAVVVLNLGRQAETDRELSY